MASFNAKASINKSVSIVAIDQIFHTMCPETGVCDFILLEVKLSHEARCCTRFAQKLSDIFLGNVDKTQQRNDRHSTEKCYVTKTHFLLSRQVIPVSYSKFWQIYFHCTNCTSRHPTVCFLYSCITFASGSPSPLFLIGRLDSRLRFSAVSI